MKKFLLSVVALALAGSAMAGSLGLRASQSKPLPNKHFTAVEAVEATGVASGLKAPSRAGEASMPYSLAGTPKYAVALTFSDASGQGINPAGMEFAMAAELSAQVATKYAGSKITAIRFYTSNNALKVNAITSGNVFLCSDFASQQMINVTPFSGITKKCVTEVTVPLSAPYTLEAGKSVNFGYSFTIKSTADKYMILDGINSGNTDGGWFATKNSSGAWQWQNLAELGVSSYGSFCIAAIIEGDNLPQNEVVLLGSQLPNTTEAGKPFQYLIAVNNQASNTVTSVDVRTTIGTEAPVTSTVQLENAIAYNQQSMAIVTASYPATGVNLPVKIEVVGVNGNANKSTANANSSYLLSLPEGAGYPRNVLVEEATGTWCGWCPMGFVMMENLKAKYTDGSVVRVAVHGKDAMSAVAYNTFISKYVSGYPSAFFNRWTEMSPGDSEGIDDVITYLKSFPSPAKIEFTAEYNTSDKKMYFDVNSTFALNFNNAAGDYRLFAILTEDKVGPYVQQNYFAGEAYSPESGDWNTKGAEVSMLFDDVARNLYQFAGVISSVPVTAIEAGNPYNYKFSCTASKIKVLDNSYAAIGLLNTKTGEVEQIVMKPYQQLSGVKEVVADKAAASVAVEGNTVSVAGAAAQVYTVAGAMVATIADGASAQLPSGLYIVKAGSTVKKVAL